MNISNAEGYQMSVFGADGRLYHSQLINANEVSISTANWSNQVYQVVLKNQDKVATEKVVK